MADLLSAENSVFKVYATHAMVLIFKMFLMAYLTGFYRFRKKVFIAPEDTSSLGGQVKYDDPDVERVRRAHLNDLENIPIFLITGILFVLADPPKLMAQILIRLYTIFRIGHTIVYVFYIIPQPARSIMFNAALLVNLIMMGLVISNFFHV